LNHIKIATKLFVHNAEYPCLSSLLTRLHSMVHIFGGSILGLWQETGNRKHWNDTFLYYTAVCKTWI